MLFCIIHNVTGFSLTDYVWKRLKTLKTKSAPKADAVSVITYLKCCHDRNDEKAVIKKKETKTLERCSQKELLFPHLPNLYLKLTWTKA